MNKTSGAIVVAGMFIGAAILIGTGHPWWAAAFILIGCNTRF